MRWIRLKDKKRIGKRPVRRGSATVLLCILFVTLVGALAVTYEAAERKAAISMAEASFDNAGRSILAGYDKELFERYGIFAFEGDEEKTEKRLEKLAKVSIENTKIANCKVKSVEAEQSAYALSDPDNLMIQLREITKRTALLDAADSLKDDLGTARKKMKEKKQSEQKVQELEEERTIAKRNAEEAVRQARAAEEAEKENEEAVLQQDDEDPAAELEVIENAEKEQNHLKEQLNSMNGEPELSGSWGRTLKNGRIIDSLPSVAAGCREEREFSGETELEENDEGGAGQAASDDLVTIAYIEHFFHNKLDGDAGDERFFQCETEYILFGGKSDKANYRKAYVSIFAVRTACNMAYLYIDSVKRNQIFTTAKSITPMPYALLTQLLITALWASLESYNDMKNLENGHGVPIMKTKETWMTDINDVIKLIKEGGSEEGFFIPIPEGSHMTYSRYLDMFLMIIKRDTKLYRIMDLIQINLKGTVREDFTFADHFTGFVLKSEIGKKSHAVGVRNSTADINMTHTYLTGG